MLRRAALLALVLALAPTAGCIDELQDWVGDRVGDDAPTARSIVLELGGDPATARIGDEGREAAYVNAAEASGDRRALGDDLRAQGCVLGAPEAYYATGERTWVVVEAAADCHGEIVRLLTFLDVAAPVVRASCYLVDEGGGRATLYHVFHTGAVRSAGLVKP